MHRRWRISAATCVCLLEGIAVPRTSGIGEAHSRPGSLIGRNFLTRLRVRSRTILKGSELLSPIFKLIAAVLVGLPLLVFAAGYVSRSLQQARNSGDEASAIAALRSIWSGQATFTSVQCNGRYAGSLTMLGTPPAGASVGFVSPELGAADVVEKSGYRFTIVAPDGTQSAGLAPACEGSVLAFTATAIPVDAETGKRYFSVDQDGEVTQATSASFDDASPVR
jgi:hypothetical protein